VEYSRKIRNHTGFDGFCDADWGTSDTSRSTNVRYNGAPIQWQPLDGETALLQMMIFLGRVKEEYYAASTAAVEIIYLR
jgi:hypothetical protein